MNAELNDTASESTKLKNRRICTLIVKDSEDPEDANTWVRKGYTVDKVMSSGSFMANDCPNITIVHHRYWRDFLLMLEYLQYRQIISCVKENNVLLANSR